MRLLLTALVALCLSGLGAAAADDKKPSAPKPPVNPSGGGVDPRCKSATEKAKSACTAYWKMNDYIKGKLITPLPPGKPAPNAAAPSPTTANTANH